MNKLTLIGTMHKEMGKCNADSLYRIIEKIKPDVIFEETSPYQHMCLYKFGAEPRFPEQKAIQKYIQNYNSINIPIDTLKPPRDFDQWEMKLAQDLSTPNNYNREFHEILEFMYNYRVNNGIEGINTPYYDDLNNKKYLLCENYIYNYREYLIRYYNDHNEFIFAKRETEMINNILEYCNQRKNNFNAVILIGADHRTSIMEKLKRINNIEYDFFYGSS